MSCRRAYEIDLPAYLADPHASAHPEFAAFRDHYPRCPECAAEVRAWTELEALLRTPAAHPSPEKLLALEDRPESLGAVERAALEDHLAGCTSCRDELGALRGFEPHAAAQPAGDGGGSALGALLAAVRGLLVQPAFAYALALLFAAPLVYRLVTSEAELLQRDLAAPESIAEKKQDGAALPGELGERDAPAPDERVAKTVLEERSADAALPEAPAPAAAEPAAEPTEAAKSAPGPKRRAADVDADVESDTPAARQLEQLRSLGYIGSEPAPRAERAKEEGATATAEAPVPEAFDDEAATPQGEARADAEAREVPLDELVPQQNSGLGYVIEEPRPEHAARSRAAEVQVAREMEAEAAAPALRLEPAGPGLHRLHVPLEPGMQEVEVRVTPPGGGRMIAEHFRGAAGEVTLEIPSAWIVPGTWQVERRALGRRDVLTLEVR